MAAEFTTETVPLNAGEVHYHTAGEGQPLLYLHPAAGFRLSGPVEQLAAEFRVIAPIVPGFDGTPMLDGLDTVRGVAGLYAELIDKLANGKCDVVGQSLGAWIGAWLAIDHPEKVEPLVLASPAGFRHPDSPPLSFEPEVMLKQLFAHPEKRPPETKTAEQLAGNREAVTHYGIGSAWDEELNARIGEISCLTLVVHGTKDVRVPLDAVQMLRRTIPHSHLVFIYDAAHSIEVDQPERVGNLYLDFLLRGEAFIVNATSRSEAA
jgi:pimeloyl-ACP methyl ester carboxylesterase